jgi:hypothetical protein
MRDDLSGIEELARDWLKEGWDQRLPQNCLDIIKELRFWRWLAAKRVTVDVYCPGCDMRVECDALDAYRYSEKNPRCSCGVILQVRIGVAESMADIQEH